MKVKTPEGGMGAMGRLFVTVLVILVIVLVTVFFAVRTEGGHTFIEERLEKCLGVPISIADMRIGWPYALVLESVRSEGFDEEGGMPGFAAQEVRLGPSLRARYRVYVRRGHLRLVETVDQMWEPAFFARLGELPYGDLADVTHMLPLSSGRIELEIADGRMEWFDKQGRIISSAHGVNYHVTPVHIPGRNMQHHALSLITMTRPNGARMSDVAREWLASETIAHVELMDEHLEGAVTP